MHNGPWNLTHSPCHFSHCPLVAFKAQIRLIPAARMSHKLFVLFVLWVGLLVCVCVCVSIYLWHVQLAASACKCKCCQCSAENWIDSEKEVENLKKLGTGCLDASSIFFSLDLVKCAMFVQTADVSLFAVPAPFNCKSLIQIAKVTTTRGLSFWSVQHWLMFCCCSYCLCGWLSSRLVGHSMNSIADDRRRQESSPLDGPGPNQMALGKNKIK